MEWSFNSVLRSMGMKDHSIGLALSGGGVRGFTHIGVIIALQKFGINPNIVSGVSSGSIAATLYGAGLNPLEIAGCFDAISRFADFSKMTIPKEGLFKLDKFGKMLESWLPVKYIEELSTPTVICATDLDHGRCIGWVKGEIVPRVLASCSIPVIFKPVKIDGINYVDGGVLRNLPAWAIRRHCTRLIGSNCSPLARNYKYKNSIIDVAMRSYHLMSKSNVRQDLKLCDVIIQPSSLSGVKTFDLAEMRKMISVGYDAACVALENAHLKL